MTTNTRHWLSHSVVKFAVVGITNTLLTIATIFLLKWAAGVSDVPANLTGYLVGLACSFVLNKRWTFGHSGRLISTFLRFIVIFGASYLLNLGIVLLLIRAGTNSYWAHLAGMPFYTITFYFGCRYFVFSNKAPEST